MPRASTGARSGATRRTLLVALAVTLTLTGCGAAPEDAALEAPLPAQGPLPSSPESESESESEPEPDAPEPEPELAPRPTPVPDTTAPGTCATAIRDAIASTVSTQLDAFAAEDFTAAYEMTSPYFRLVFATDDFEQMIRTDYPELVGNDGHRFDECQVRNRRAFIVVGVRAGAREVVLRYDLSEEPDGWRIDGAGLLPGITLPPDRLV